MTAGAARGRAAADRAPPGGELPCNQVSSLCFQSYCGVTLTSECPLLTYILSAWIPFLSLVLLFSLNPLHSSLAALTWRFASELQNLFFWNWMGPWES